MLLSLFAIWSIYDPDLCWILTHRGSRKKTDTLKVSESHPIYLNYFRRETELTYIQQYNSEFTTLTDILFLEEVNVIPSALIH